MADDTLPLDATPRAVGEGKNWERAYASPSSLARVVVGFLAAIIAIDLIGIATLQARIDLVEQVQNGVLVTDSQLRSADDHVSFALAAWLVGLVATAGAFVWWFQRLYGNLASLGVRDLRFARGLVNRSLIRSVCEPHPPGPDRARHVAGIRSGAQLRIGPDWRSGSRGTIVGVWWIVFIGSGIFDRIASARPTTTPGEIVGSDHLFMVSNLVDAAAAAIAIVFVVRLTRRQRTRATILAIAES